MPAGLRPIYAINPIVGVLESYRWMLFPTASWPGALLLIPIAISTILVVTGAIYFQRTEHTLRRRDLSTGMSEPAITVEKLGKRYVIGAGHTDVLAERLQRAATAPVRALRRRRPRGAQPPGNAARHRARAVGAPRRFARDRARARRSA